MPTNGCSAVADIGADIYGDPVRILVRDQAGDFPENPVVQPVLALIFAQHMFGRKYQFETANLIQRVVRAATPRLPHALYRPPEIRYTGQIYHLNHSPALDPYLISRRNIPHARREIVRKHPVPTSLSVVSISLERDRRLRAMPQPHMHGPVSRPGRHSDPDQREEQRVFDRRLRPGPKYDVRAEAE